MAEWLMLLLLVPAIVVPVVLLVGFAGCNQVFGVKSTTIAPSPPILASAEGTSGSIIHLTWTWTGDLQTLKTFHFVRTNPDGTETPFDTLPSTSPFETDDVGLKSATPYGYRVQAVFNDGSSTNFSPAPPAPPLAGTTLSLEPTFTQTLTSDEPNWEGFTLVQRIEMNRLFRSGTQVLLILHASSMGEALLDKIYISKPDPAAADPYQPGPDLTALYDNPNSPLPVPMNTPQTPPAIVGPVNYNLDHTQALLIAFEFHASPESDVAFADVATADASAYYIQASEASSRPRSSGYTPAGSRVYLIERIEVG
jgi:hypothetical protein